ncbi:MAG TPA: molybdenum cofactor biosynthesis protein MoaE [Bdellovibrionota bacterium]|nr:molybdenum cofactor biosynthesis protein MoaE [Bdellovibrionota bacterium]
MKPYIDITNQKLDVTPLRDVVWAPNCGAVVTFEGIVRDRDDGEKVTSITYEAYDSMARKEIEKIFHSAIEQWPDVRLAAAHRIGILAVGETSVIVLAASPHRKEVFLAGEFVIDEIKRSVPIWKKEMRESGSRWKK